MAVSDREHCKHAKEAWDLLRKTHKVEGGAREVMAIRRMRDLKMEEGGPVQEVHRRIPKDHRRHVSSRPQHPRQDELNVLPQWITRITRTIHSTPNAPGTRIKTRTQPNRRHHIPPHPRQDSRVPQTDRYFIVEGNSPPSRQEDRQVPSLQQGRTLQVGVLGAEWREAHGARTRWKGGKFGKGKKENKGNWKDREEAHFVDYGLQAGSDIATSAQALFAQTKHGYIADSGA